MRPFGPIMIIPPKLSEMIPRRLRRFWSYIFRGFNLLIIAGYYSTSNVDIGEPGVLGEITSLVAKNPAPQTIIAVAAALSTTSILTSVIATQLGMKELVFSAINYIGTLFAAKSKDKSGSVYENTSKEPVKGALVSIFEYTSMKLLSSAITDKDGRYYFTVKPGQYVLSVVKNGYIFPSKTAKENKIFESDVYFGQTITVSNKASAINAKIPLDSTADAKSTKNVIITVLRSSLFRLTLILVGSIFSLLALIINPSTVNYIMLTAYLIIWILEYFIQNRNVKFSRVVDDATKKPIDLALSRVVSEDGKIKKTYVTDFNGRFMPYLQDPGDTLVIERSGYKKFTSKSNKKGFLEKKTISLKKL